MDQNELMHHGIRGQKWGVRRYQNADGSLTSAGKKKYGTKTNFERVQAAKKAASPEAMKAKRDRERAQARTEAEIAKYKKKAGLIDKDSEKSKSSNDRPKSYKEMSNEELSALITRMNLEKNYFDAKIKLAGVTPQKISKGEKFINWAKETYLPGVKRATTEVGEKWLKKTLSRIMGTDEVNDLEKLAKDAKVAGYKKQIYEAEEAGLRLKEKKSGNKNGENNQPKNESKPKTENESNDKKSKANNVDSKVNKSPEYFEKKQFTDATKDAFKSESKTNDFVKGEVIGKATSKASEKFTNPNSWKFNANDWVDGSWKDVSPSSYEIVPFKQTGMNYINQFLLEDKKGK